MKRNVRTTHLTLLVFGVAITLLGAILAVFWPSIFKLLLAKELTLSPTSKSFSEWKSPSVPLYFDVYLYNWTNPEEISNENVKPIFTQHGPYRFKETRDKEDVKFHRDSTVSYKPISYYYFDAEGSNGTLDDVIVNLNIVAIGAAGQSVQMSYKKRKVVSMALNMYEQELTVAKSVRELLFEGYEDDMVTAGKLGINEDFNPDDIPYDKIGWFYKRNATTEHTFNYKIFTGKSDISKLGSIEKFNDTNSFENFYSGKCAKLEGSTGELFAPDLSADSINLFMGDLCRTVPYDFEKEVDIHGITGYKFAAGERAVDNGTKYPENLCYNGGSEDLFPSGVMNISACRYSSPIFFSYPHFYEADEFYLNDIEGLSPSKEKHQSYFVLEQMTGAPLEVVIRYQANFLLRDYEDISLYQYLPTKFIPAMWFEQKFKMSAEMAEQIKFAIQIPNMGRIVGLQILGFGLILVVISSIIRCIAARRASDTPTDINLAEANGARRQVETSSPLLTQGKKIIVQKMDSATN